MSSDRNEKLLRINDEDMKAVNGGVAASGQEAASESSLAGYGASGKKARSFTIKSSLATGEPIEKVPQGIDEMSTSDKKTGKRLPKVVFADKGKQI